MQIAVAGGTSPTLGASITSALLNAGHKPILLSRSPSKPSNSPNTSIETRSVDYTSIASLADALKDIHTVISVLLIPGPEMETYQLNLLAAAEQAGVKRFAPSEFALPPSSQKDVEFDQIKLRVWERVRESMEGGRIDAARFPTGMWMNYLAIGCPHRQSEGLAGFREGSLLVHLDEEVPWAEIPLLPDGGYPRLTMTDLRDIGRFVCAAVEMEEPWGGRELGMVGETVGFGEFVSLCEGYVGKVERREVTEADLKERLAKTPPEDFMKRMETEIALLGCRDGFVVKPTLNALCRVQPRSIREFMQTYWGQ